MKYAIVTGAYGGMGYATVKKLVKDGFTVFALDKFVKTAEENVVPIEVDVTDFKSIERVFNLISGITNEISLIIHFAGIYMLDSLVELSNSDAERIFKVNFFGAFYINKI